MAETENSILRARAVRRPSPPTPLHTQQQQLLFFFGPRIAASKHSTTELDPLIPFYESLKR